MPEKLRKMRYERNALIKTYKQLSFGATVCFNGCQTSSVWRQNMSQGCHGQGKVREKQKFFKVREKSGNFAKSQGKSQFLSKSVKSQGILFSGWRKVL